jgi:diguanylate cyclase (GGDEF)-like protein
MPMAIGMATSHPTEPADSPDSAVGAVLTALTSALDSRDPYTSAHSQATVVVARAVGQSVGLIGEGLLELERVAALHDVGKLGVPTEIIRKPGPLNDHEWEAMREHPAIGQRILKGVPALAGVARAVRHCHERWDGDGYPDQLAGEEIPLTSRIVFACDAYQAMVSDRPYRAAMTEAAAIAELNSGAGSQFDPHVVQTLLGVLGEDAPPVSFEPRETRELAHALALADIAVEMGADDMFVFRKASPRRYSHLAGVGRGDGWAGNIELDWDEEPHLRAAVRSGEASCVPLPDAGRVVGPYYAVSAVIVPCSDDTVVVFGSPTDALDEACTERASDLAKRAAALVHDVSAAKRLADELEVLEAVQSITTLGAEEVWATLTQIAERAAQALSCEFGAAMTLPAGDRKGTIGWTAGAWQPARPELLARAMNELAESAESGPILRQDAASATDLPEGFTRKDGVSALHARLIGDPAVALLVVVHAEPRLRGFTALCQRVARGICDGADVVVRRALAQERLAVENERLSERLHTDALTGVVSRAGWEETLAVEELHRGRSGAISSLAIVDLDGLKLVNDRDGHAAGDGLLRACAAILIENSRATDVIARIGGDEFGVLLRYSDEHAAATWRERLSRRLTELNGGDRCQPLTISVGIAQASIDMTIGDAVALADRRMYAEKSARCAARNAPPTS